ncbi:vesicle-associated membrane protein 711 isoform X1 [Gossypium raimondii]|uniref:vesicle-associated membrane protein 711 isoform X1 n=1 Tax=Gossypium raimondii TaxID=29730 RepID=UPI00227A71C5|nr:vesicle-associated membrane protein 711 isoform X1 [Gossypium raimondii]
MAILYALVARGSVVLAEFTAASTNASAIARQILEKTSGDNDINVSYSQDRYIFHVKRTDGLTVLCMADESAGRRIPFAFLEDMHQRFVRTYGGAVLSALPYGMNDEFSRVLSQQMEYYSNDPNADRINRLKGEMSQGCAHNNPPNCCLYRDCVCLQGAHVTILCLKRGQQLEIRTRSAARCFFFPFVSVFVCLFLFCLGDICGMFLFQFPLQRVVFTFVH